VAVQHRTRERGHAQADSCRRAVQPAKLYLVSSHTYPANQPAATKYTHVPIHPPHFHILTMGLIMKEHKRIVRRSVPVPRGRHTDGLPSPSPRPNSGVPGDARPFESSRPGFSSAPRRRRKATLTPTPSSTRGVGGSKPRGGRRGEDYQCCGSNDKANQGQLARAYRSDAALEASIPGAGGGRRGPRGEDARGHVIVRQ
jgi:hypothetical protein